MAALYPLTSAELVVLPRTPEILSVRNATKTKLIKVNSWKIVDRVVVQAVVCRTTVTPTEAGATQSRSVLVTETAEQEMLWPDFSLMPGAREKMGVEFREADEVHESLVTLERDGDEDERPLSLWQCLLCCWWPSGRAAGRD
ncbi:hypothetical protein A1O3_06115 [Capronia epimyces CBS 606.96]|uniref:Uncharacterized protein n=1 Tax=Capronia epimyces CBS 606.96 TaxID=1182542 RepID=W9XP30_9EURO|nr:uncharacterized protein A1O3_06115 [Capronia epimyces CBS 606.96]EXJ82302.1 hypothetical protein A1O3_06115 [Capronia epimyces CBS 606.96]